MESSSDRGALDDPEAIAKRVVAALGWDGKGAPRLLASGRGSTAQALLDQARELGVPLHEDPDLAALLAQIPVSAEIPPELYHVVAEVLAWIFAASGVDPRHRVGADVLPSADGICDAVDGPIGHQIANGGSSSAPRSPALRHDEA
ncbi:MAG: EscU/YscU/HrcU family type III secretion system export apparatus switch protein [Thioalkalivibrionaceae bacterium]